MIDYQYLAGGLTHEPEVRFTPNGNALTTLNLAQSDSKKTESGEWETTRNRYIRATIWDTDRTKWSDLLAGLSKGDRLVLLGKLVTNTWEKDGEKRSQLEFQAQHAYTDPTNTTQQSSGQTGWQAQDNKGGFGQNTNDEQPPF